MKRLPAIRILGTILLCAGIHPIRLWSSIVGLPRYIVEAFSYWISYRRTSGGSRFRLVPALSDRHDSSGVARGHYFLQDLWAAKQVLTANPDTHFDIGSRIDGFVAHLLCFRSVVVFDVRPLTSSVPGLFFRQLDLMKSLPQDCPQSDSVSCLHALEHFGLGRYGDDIDLNGWRLGLKNISSLLRPEGKLYLSVPVGVSAIEFNAQRIFKATDVIDEAESHGLFLESFSLIDDQGNFLEDCAPSDSFELACGCGCFIFVRRIGLA